MRVQEHLELGHIFGRIQNGAIPAVGASVLVTLVWALFGFGWLDFTLIFFGLLALPILAMSWAHVWIQYQRFVRAEEAWSQVLALILEVSHRIFGSFVVSGRAKKPKEQRERLILRLGACSHAIRGELRGVHAQDDLADLLGEEEFNRFRGVSQGTTLLLNTTRDEVRAALAEDRMSEMDVAAVLTTLGQLSQAVSVCRLLATTHAPPIVGAAVPMITIGYCVCLPFGLVSTLGWLTPFAMVLASVCFLLPNAIASSLSSPFGSHPDCLPLYRDSRAVETELKGTLGQDALPRNIEPFGGVIR